MEEFNVYEGIMEGLKDALAYKQGDHSKGKVSVGKISAPTFKAEDVARARKELNLTQSGLAYVMGVSPKTVEAWETGKNEPSGAASRLLYLLDGDHSLLERLTGR